MALSVRSSSVLLLIFLIASISPIFAQELRLVNTQTEFEGEPQGDRAGSLWVWRNAEGLRVSAPTSPRAEQIDGAFLRHQVSAAATVILTVRQNGGGTTGHEDKNGLQLQWHSRNGHSLGALSLARHEDDPLPQFVMNDSGSHTMLFEPALARATFLTFSGQALAQIYLFEKVIYNNERPAYLAASADRFFVLSQPTPAEAQEAHPPTLVCYSLEGTERWRRELEPGTAGNLALSPSGTWLIANSYQFDPAMQHFLLASRFYDDEGRPFALEACTFRAAAFSSTEQQVVLMDRRQLRCLSIPAGKTLWQFDLKDRKKMFAAIAPAPDAHSYFVLAAMSAFKQNRFVYEDAHLLEIAKEGAMKTDLPVAQTLINPSLTVSGDQQVLLLAAEDLLLQYEIAVEPQTQRKQ